MQMALVCISSMPTVQHDQCLIDQQAGMATTAAVYNRHANTSTEVRLVATHHTVYAYLMMVVSLLPQ